MLAPVESKPQKRVPVQYKNILILYYFPVFLGSSAVEQPAVNR